MDSCRIVEEEMKQQKTHINKNLDIKNKETEKLNDLISKLQLNLETRNERILTRDKELMEKESEIEKLWEELRVKNEIECKEKEEKNGIKERLENRENEIETLRDEAAEKNKQLKEALTNVSELMTVARNVRNEILDRNEKIKVLEGEKEALQADIDTLNSSISQVREENVVLKNKSKSKESTASSVKPTSSSEVMDHSVTNNNKALNRFIEDMSDFKKFVHNRLGALNDLITKGPNVELYPQMPELEKTDSDDDRAEEDKVQEKKAESRNKKRKKKKTKPYVNDDNRYETLKQFNKERRD